MYGSTNQAAYPPRGWNSFVAFSWVITEQEFLQNAQVMADRLLPFGYEVTSLSVYTLEHFNHKFKGPDLWASGMDLFHTQ